jgi:hypothetical protein
MTHRNRARLSKLSLALVAVLAAAPAFAQSTSSGVIGHVVGADGQPVAGAEVTITHVESGTVSRAVTDANGNYASRGLRVGGPYTITVNKAGAGVSTQQNVFLQLNQVADIDTTLNADMTTLGSVQVVGSGVDIFTSDNKGLGTSVSGRQLETAVNGERSLDGIARLDPRITVIDQNDGSISVAGQNNRYNNISVDGLSQSDPFGLNANGLPYTGSPISPDVIAAYDLKVTDYDVASDTVGANINAVTKSGTNEFHGSVYYAFKNSDMVGKFDGEKYDGFDKNETTGFTLGGPILKDRLFFFASYEEQKISGLKGVGTDAVTNGKISAEDVQAAIDIGTALGMQPGTYGNSGVSLEDKRYLAKLDWNISDNQRASFTYQRTEEARPTPYGSRVKDNSVVLSSNWYNVASKTDNYSFQLFSDWTENFSTEFKAGYQKFANTNGAAIDQPEIWLNIPAHDGYSGGTIYMGEDEYRHENSIGSKKFTATLSGTLYAGDHTIKGGVDYLSNEVSDVFGRDLHGVYTFDGLDNFEDAIYSKFTKTIIPNGVSLADVAGTWTYSQISPFLQDTWQVNDNLSLVYGVRINYPKADHAPPEQPVWEANYGYPNNTTLGSKNKVVEPRLAFNYSFDTERSMQLRGGIGLFQTVPPYVWMTNPYLNNGVVSLKNYTNFSYNPADPFSPDPYNQPGLQSADVSPGACTASANCQIDVLDPDFKLPTAWKASLGLDMELPVWGLIGTIDYQRIKNKNAIAYLAPNLGTPNGTLPDGRDSYWKTYPADGTIGDGKNNGSIPEIYYRSTLLTNTDLGSTDSLTLALTKPMDHGFSGSLSATMSRGDEVNPGKSSQAWSNYNYVVRTNPNEIIAARSGYVIPMSVKATLNWDHAFFGDYKTTVSVFYNGHSGMPYSWVYGGSSSSSDVNGDNVGFEDAAYIPLRNDPIVNYGTATAAQIEAFQDFIDSDFYLSTHRGRIAERNSSHQPWQNQLDLGLQQEFPGFFKGNKAVVRLDVYNFLNLLNSDWGQVETLGFYGTRTLAEVTDVKDGQYVYDLGTESSPSWQQFGVYDSYTNPARVVSRWSALLTVRYEF